MIQDLCEIPFSPLQMLLCSHSSSAVTLQIANLRCSGDDDELKSVSTRVLPRD